MNVTIKSLGIQPVSLTNEVVPEFMEYQIPGCEVVSMIAAFGKCMLQSAQFEDYGWVYSVFDIKEEVTLLLTYFMSLIVARISLKGNFNFEIKPLKNLLVNENQFNIFFLPGATSIVHLTKGKHVLFEPIIVRNSVWQTFSFFPVFEKFKQNILQSKTSAISDRQLYINASIADSIYKIIHSPFSQSVRQFHVDTIKELSVKMLKEASQLQPDNKKFTVEEIERIYAAKEFIDSKVPHHYSIGQIARRVGINEKKLKQGFKEIFSIGLYGYFQNRVIEIARIEIEQTLHSIKEISLHAGYKNANNFSAAFRKKFGKSPLEWRKKFDSNNEDVSN